MTAMEYWKEMKDKSAAEIAAVSERHAPLGEDDLKRELAHVLKHGTCKDAADCIVETVEHMVACHMLKASEHKV